MVGWLIVQISPTASLRITDYIAGLKDPTKGSAHVLWSFEAFVKGGWLGVGIGKAETKLIGLPVPPTDSIYAVVGEETGVFGALGLVFLYGLLLWRSLKIARRAPDELGSLLAAGLGIWIAMEAFINMAVMVNLLPFAGNALPFISSGGSNLVVSLAAIGIMLNISRLSTRRKKKMGSSSMRLLICAGGTGGGVYPALAVLQALPDDDPSIHTLGRDCRRHGERTGGTLTGTF